MVLDFSWQTRAKLSVCLLTTSPRLTFVHIEGALMVMKTLVNATSADPHKLNIMLFTYA